MQKKIAILGSTGSIGTNSIKVCKLLGEQIKIIGIAGRSNLELLAQQVNEIKPEWVSVTTKEDAQKLSSMINNSTKIIIADAQLPELCAADNIDIVLCAISGTAGFLPVLHAIRAKKTIALASKEILVMAGELVMQEAKENGVNILPVDSEHSAIFQCLEGKPHEEINKLIITASGGPFFKTPIEEFSKITIEQALKHPTWTMGQKITIDSATMMNKGLELIEAAHLFNIPESKIEITIHPQSIVHSLVEFIDSSILAQIGNPEMCLPIQYALTWPKRVPSLLPQLNLAQIGKLEFFEPDCNKFPSLALARQAIKAGGTLSTVYNAANEVAVNRFVKQQCRFIDIFKIVEETMANHNNTPASSLEEIFAADTSARLFATNLKI